MPPTHQKVIVFGPTGSVGALVARTARQHGANVFLAMRDPSKAIKGIEENASGYERVKADLNDPASVTAAVKNAGATAAFVYLSVHSGDHMAATLTALHDAGITNLVLLSSYTVGDTPSSVPQGDLIGYVHAQVELNIEKIFAKGQYTALRPGGFATNSLSWKEGIHDGEVKLLGFDVSHDCITNGDIGRVGGTILAQGSEEHAVFLYGPEDIRRRDIVQRVAKALGKEVSIAKQTPDEMREEYKARGTPPPFTEYLIAVLTDEKRAVPKPHREQGTENVLKYTGKRAETLEEWVQENKDLWV